MADKEMTIEVPVENENVEETETKKITIGQKVKNFGLKVKGGAKKVVDSKAFRIITGVVSTVAVGAVALVITGVVGGDSDDDVSLLPEGESINMSDGDFEVSDVSTDDVEEVEI